MGNRVIKAKKAKGLGDSVRSREPRFMCPDHRERLVFSKLNQVWECPSPGCNKRKLPSMDRTDTTIIKSAPRVVGRQDEDGDIHWYLNFMEENIMVELPFQSTGATAEGSSVSVTYTTDDQAVFGPKGEKIDLGQLSEPEPDTI
ncbi:hypothetical protein BH789_gp096 [Gordonia phage GMA6]|uniref:Uncharacterized protein n=1 Tax=Gordonia phage GMA6 TaxID=1647285 RepID=A0A0K0NLE7_9CAUD|nr:hypothetical protein BH789_gp096 [Gordonia phage GMA6]AKL88377.1 hypothetical protein GMA6_96 [Gordonia phage GMA6]